MVTYTLKLKDDDVLFMDENDGAIVLSDEYFEDIEPDYTVDIHFLEDEDSILHRYKVKEHDTENHVVTLDWIEQLNESLLTEAPLSKLIQKATKKTDKQKRKFQDRLLKNLKKMFARDMGSEGTNWKFYFAKEDGSYSAPVDYKTARQKYQDMGDDLSPEIVNAIVTTDTNFIVRRGMEDLYRKGVRLDKETGKFSDKFKMPWESDSEFETEDNNDVDNATNDDQDFTNDTSTQTDDNNTKETSTDNKSDSRYDLGISSKSYGHFLKLLYVMRPKLYDAFDKPVDVSNIKELTSKVKYDNLADFEIEIDGKKVPAIDWIKTAVKNKVLMEKILTEEPSITFDDADIMNPDSINLKDKIKQAEDREKAEAEAARKLKREQELKELHKDTIEKLETSQNRGDSVEETLNVLFDELVPGSGPADTVAGEFVRAIVRIMFRDMNDGDKFFEGYGLETCGSSAEYLFDHGFEEDIDNILENVYRLADDDDKYTDALRVVGEHIIERIKNDPSVVWQENDEDSRDYSNSYIEERQPRYEFECYGSDDVIALVNEGILTSWDLTRYVDEMLSYDHVYEGASASRPWSHHDTSVTVENLTKDGYEHLEDSFSRNVDGWWEDLTSEYADALSDEESDDDYDEE